MRIQVTQEHIDRGREAIPNRAPCYVCPVAQALIDAGYQEVSVGQFEAYWWMPDEGRTAIAYLPEVASDWISAFDDGLHVEPFSIDLDVDMEP